MDYSEWIDRRIELQAERAEAGLRYAEAHVGGWLGAPEVDAFAAAEAAVREHDLAQPRLP